MDNSYVYIVIYIYKFCRVEIWFLRNNVLGFINCDCIRIILIF